MRQLESILIGFFKKCVYFHKKNAKKNTKIISPVRKIGK